MCSSLQEVYRHRCQNWFDFFSLLEWYPFGTLVWKPLAADHVCSRRQVVAVAERAWRAVVSILWPVQLVVAWDSKRWGCCCGTYWRHFWAGTLSSRHVSSCDVTLAVWMWEAIWHRILWRRFTLLSLVFTSRDLTWSSGRLTRQHASHISVVAHISWAVTNVSSAI